MIKEAFIFEVGDGSDRTTVTMDRIEFDEACLVLAGQDKPASGLTLDTLVYCKNYCGIEGIRYWQTPKAKLMNDTAYSSFNHRELFGEPKRYPNGDNLSLLIDQIMDK